MIEIHVTHGRYNDRDGSVYEARTKTIQLPIVPRKGDILFIQSVAHKIIDVYLHADFDYVEVVAAREVYMMCAQVRLATDE
jgi:hypothetical protein